MNTCLPEASVSCILVPVMSTRSRKSTKPPERAVLCYTFFMSNNSRGFSSLISTLVIAGLVVLVGGYYLTKENGPGLSGREQAANENGEHVATTSSESDASTATPGKPVTAYIVSIDSNTVVLDYVDALYGEAAIQAMITDGYCKKDEECHTGAPLYDRNVNPMTRTFALASDVQIASARGQVLTLQGLKEYGLAFETQGRRYGQLFTISFNDKNEVSKIEGEFRP